jgi:hypothetical protein
MASNTLAIIATVALLTSCKGKDKGDDGKPPISLVGTDASARTPSDAGVAPVRAPFAKPAIASKVTPKGWDVTIEIHATPGVEIPSGDVPYTAELYTITRQPAIADVVESNVLETGLVLDLDGDGKTTGGLTVGCTEDGRVTAGSTSLEPIGDMRLDELSYEGSIAGRIGDKGAHVILYRPCKDNFVNVGLAPADQPIEVHTVAGPAMQLILLERAESPTAKPQASVSELTMDGKPVSAELYSTYVYEAIFEPGGGWTTAQWYMVPLGATAREHTLTFTIATDRREDIERILVTRIDVGAEPNVRRRSVASSRRLDEAP